MRKSRSGATGRMLSLWSLATKMAFKYKYIWRDTLTEGEAKSAAFFGFLDAPDSIPIMTCWIYGYGELLNEVYWIRYGIRKKRKHLLLPIGDRLNDVSAPGLPPDMALILKETVTRVCELLPSLRTKEELLLRGVAFEDKTTREIANEIEISEKTASSMIALARRRLRAHCRGNKLVARRIKGRNSGSRELVEISRE